jgi:hypothetical protein
MPSATDSPVTTAIAAVSPSCRGVLFMAANVPNEYTESVRDSSDESTLQKMEANIHR